MSIIGSYITTEAESLTFHCLIFLLRVQKADLEAWVQEGILVLLETMETQVIYHIHFSLKILYFLSILCQTIAYLSP